MKAVQTVLILGLLGCCPCGQASFFCDSYGRLLQKLAMSVLHPRIDTFIRILDQNTRTSRFLDDLYGGTNGFLGVERTVGDLGQPVFILTFRNAFIQTPQERKLAATVGKLVKIMAALSGLWDSRGQYEMLLAVLGFLGRLGYRNWGNELDEVASFISLTKQNGIQHLRRSVLRKSVVTVQNQDGSQATAFVISETERFLILLTNSHVVVSERGVDRTIDVTHKPVDIARAYDWFPGVVIVWNKYFALLGHDHFSEIKPDQDVDLALILVSKDVLIPNGVRLRPLLFGGLPQDGQPVAIVSFNPRDTFEEGVAFVTPDHQELTVLGVDTRFGNSGSPVVSKNKRGAYGFLGVHKRGRSYPLLGSQRLSSIGEVLADWVVLDIQKALQFGGKHSYYFEPATGDAPEVPDSAVRAVFSTLYELLRTLSVGIAPK